jgi:hypothetical protein
MRRCAFCGCDPYHYVDIGVGCERVAVTCCELGVAVYDHRNEDEAEVPVASRELRDVACKIADLEHQVQRRDRLIAKMWTRR